MTPAERRQGLEGCRAEYEAALAAVSARLAGAAGPERARLAAERQALRRRLELCEIERRLIDDPAALIRDYTERQREANQGAEAERDPRRREMLEARAEFCRTVAEEATDAVGTLRAPPAGSLEGILADLREAAQQAKDTVESINRAITIANRVLDGLVVLARVAAKLAV